MTTIEKVEIIKIIKAELLKTEAKVIEYKELTKPIAPENAIGRVSRMDAINNKSVVEAGLRNAEQKLASLKNVLGNQDNENFGLCRNCKKPIAIQRILFRPQSVLCVNCAK